MRPQLRRDDGQRSEISWEAANTELVQKLSRIIAEHGSDAVGVFKGTHHSFDALGRRMSNVFFRDLGTSRIFSPVTVDAPNKTLVPDLVAGAPYLFPLVDWDFANLVLIVGENPVISHGHPIPITSPSAKIRDLRRRGGMVVVIDPRRTETAALADTHLQLRPGADPAVLGFLIREVLRRHPNEDYVLRYVYADSLERLRELVEPLDLATAARIAGIPPESLQSIADQVERAGRLSIICGTGVSMGPAPNVGEWFAWALAAVTGSVDRRGGTVFNPGTLRPQEGGVLKRVANLGARAVSRPELPNFYGEIPSIALADEILSGGLRVLFSIGGNPLVCLPDRERVESALRALDLLVVVDIVENELTRISHLALPCADQFERDDITSVTDLGFPRPFVQMTRKIVEPAGEQRELWRIFWDLGHRLGLPKFQGPLPSGDELMGQEARRSRVPWSVIEASASGVVGEAPGPGWLVPNNIGGGRLDIAPILLFDEFRRWLIARAEPTTRFVLISGRLKDRVNSLVMSDPPMPPSARISPADAVELGLENGDRIEITSRNGAIEVAAEIAPSIRPGVVQVSHGSSSPAVNRLTSAIDSIDPLTGMPLYTALPVSIKKVQPSLADHKGR
jgi:anaerobic selenocysteine-containing dehydrogenase